MYIIREKEIFISIRTFLGTLGFLHLSRRPPPLLHKTKVIYQMHSCSTNVFFSLVLSTRSNEKDIYSYTVIRPTKTSVHL